MISPLGGAGAVCAVGYAFMNAYQTEWRLGDGRGQAAMFRQVAEKTVLEL